MTEALTFENIDPARRRMAMIGLAFGMLMSCLDGTIVSTCGAVIVQDLGGMELYAWMLTGYMLSETAMIPIAGKLSDRFGRKPLFLIGLFLFIAGSVVAGLSTNMGMMIVCRAVQGLGGGILVPVAMASVADFYSPEERGKVQGLLGAIFGIGSGLGPVVGGLICTYVSWHWVFYINIPFAVVCLLLTLKEFPMVAEHEEKRIDYTGMAVLTMLVLDILLYFQWIGDEMEFADPRSLVMIAIALVLAAVFVFIERRAEDPVLSPKLVRNRVILLSAVYLFLLGLCLFGMLMYVALYITMIYDYDALGCGLTMLPMVFGAMTTSVVSGILYNRTGYRFWLVLGAILITSALFLMSTMDGSGDLVPMYVYLFIFGLGMGSSLSTSMIAVQSVSSKKDVGMTTSAVSLTRNIGSTVGAALFALLIGGAMDSKFAETVFSPLADLFGLRGTGLLSLRYMDLPDFPGVGETVIRIFGESTCWAFLIASMIFIAAIVIALFIRDAKEGDPDGTVAG